MASKAEKKRRAREMKAKAKAHPLSAANAPKGKGRPADEDALRKPCGRISESRVEPTDRMKDRMGGTIYNQDWSDPIQRACHMGIITDREAEALEHYRADRYPSLELGDVSDKPGPLARLVLRERTDWQALPSTWRTPMTPERRESCAERYKAAYDAIKATGNRRAASQCALVAGGHMWTDPYALAAGAKALKAFYIDGKRKAA